MKKCLSLLLVLTALQINGCMRRTTWHTVPYPTAKTQFKPDFLPVSVWYSGGQARAPMLSEITADSEDEWRRDLAQIKELGFNTVRTWVEWTHCEPTFGDYHFENLQLLCRLAQEQDLRVIIQLYVDSAPDWVGKRYPDSQYEAQNGAKVQSQSAPGFCSDHPGVRQAVERFLSATARVAIQYPNFLGWDLWSEPHIVNWAYINYVPNVQFCFCPNTRAVFREWLKNKYGDLATLNRAWYRNFESWKEVDPPRFGTILSYTDFIDWKNFIYEKLAGDLRLRYDAIRAIDQTHVITSHAAVPSVFYTPYNGYGATDDFLMAQQVDYYGTSLYPKHNHPRRHWEYWKFAVAVDFSRSANRQNGGFYVGEMQAGKGTIGLEVGDPITPADHKTWMWSVLARGAKAINIYAYYPMSSGYESDGYGLINLDGTVTERALQAGATARLITANKNLLLNSVPAPAEVAIVYNPLAQMVGGEQRGSAPDMHSTSLISYYRIFYDNNIPVDFIHRRELETTNLDQYKLLIVPYPLMFTESAAAGLRKYIERGGKVLAEARLAWNDERGFAARQIPGIGLNAVFGAVAEKVRMSDTTRILITDNRHPAVQNLPPKAALRGAYFAESLQPLNVEKARVLATHDDGTPALIAHSFGNGETLLLGTFLGVANHPRQDKFNNQFVANLAQWAGIERPFTSSHDGLSATPVEIRLMNAPDSYLLFVFNHGEKSEEVTINLQVAQDAIYQLTEITGGNAQNGVSQANVLTFRTTIAAQDVQVWVIKTL